VTAPGGRRLWAVLELLDRQLVDRDGYLMGKVDDLELEVADEPGARPVVTAILSGTGALAGQIGGDAGAWLAAVERRLSQSHSESSRIPFELVLSVESAIAVGASRRELETNRGEKWANDVIIAKIPGAGHEAE
jgi:sporulation protein YlmC with PRC-barrel domain